MASLGPGPVLRCAAVQRVPVLQRAVTGSHGGGGGRYGRAGQQGEVRQDYGPMGVSVCVVVLFCMYVHNWLGLDAGCYGMLVSRLGSGKGEKGAPAMGFLSLHMVHIHMACLM